MRNKVNNLFNRLMIDDLDLINYAFSFLKDNHKSILQKAYGVNLDENLNSSLTLEERKGVLVNALRALKNIINHTQLITVTVDPDSDDFFHFYQIFREYDPRDVLGIVQELGEDEIELLHSIYGNNLLDSSQSVEMTASRRDLLNSIINEIKYKLNTVSKVVNDYPRTYILGYQYNPSLSGPRPKSVLEYYPDYSFDEIAAAVSMLKVEDQYYIRRAYGDGFDDSSGYSQMSYKDKNYVNLIVRKFLGRHLKESKNNSLFDLLSGYSEKEILKAINLLSNEDVSLLKKVFGFDFRGSSELIISDLEMSKVNDVVTNKLTSILENHGEVNNMETEKDVDSDFSMIFSDYGEDLVLEVVSSLEDDDINLLIKAYGSKFQDNNLSSLSDKEIRRIRFIKRFIIRNCMRKIGSGRSKKLSGNDEQSPFDFVSDDIISDRLMRNPYVKLSREEEIEFIKKAKLSYYDSVDDEEKAKYLRYYMEVFPEFRVCYEQASLEEKEKLLRHAIKESEKYRDAFLANNLRLSISIAKKYSRFNTDDIVDLSQEGNKGLMRALEKFDIERGTKFSTYAVWWVRQLVSRYVPNNSYLVRLPLEKFELVNKLEDAVDDFEKENGRSPSNQELADLMEISLDELYELYDTKNKLMPSSLDALVGEDKDTYLGEFVSSDDPSVEEVVEKIISSEEFFAALEKANLTRLEREVIYFRYGIPDGVFHTLEKTAIEFAVSTARIRNIESRALSKLRLSPELIKYCSINNIESEKIFLIR